MPDIPEPGAMPSYMTPETFRALGHDLVDHIADFLARLPSMPVTPDEPPATLRALLPSGGLPRQGAAPDALLTEAANLLFAHSLFNGHPRFLGYISSSPAPLGMLADLLAAAVNPNVSVFVASPMATEIESQTLRWIAELIGYPTDCGGVLMSGGNMANFVCLLAARTHQLGQMVRQQGIAASRRHLRIYVSGEAHNWVQRSADLCGLGTDAIHWIPSDGTGHITVDAVRAGILADREQGDEPFCVIGNAGTVGAGVVDPLLDLAELCQEQGLWFHVDGAYGGFAAALLPDDFGVAVPDDLRGIALADSVAIDPHKWLYSPLEAGCSLVRRRQDLSDTFSAHPAYYHSAETLGNERPTNFFEYGPQNSRAFRALKVWLGLRHTGRNGAARQIAGNIALAAALAQQIADTAELQLFTRELSITTFRYMPADLTTGDPTVDEYLDRLNMKLVERLQHSGELFVSNAILGGRFLLRACIVNFRTTLADMEALPGVVVRDGRAVDAELRETLGKTAN